MSPDSQTSLHDVLAAFTRPGELYTRQENNWVTCVSCGHRCRIGPGRDGICKVRFNEGGVLRVPYDYVSGLQIDPIEKKPFFHALPGSQALSFGMLGCDYHCGYCQNWYTSQALRDPLAGTPPEKISADQLVEIAVMRNIPVLTSTYNEPLITTEWAVEIFRKAKARGIRCSYVSNGNGTTEVLEYLLPFIDFYKVDLKGFDRKHYQQLGGRVDIVLETIVWLKSHNVWLEIVTLLVPGFNDADDELREIARFLASVSPEIPWHVTAFHQDYRMREPSPTSAAGLERAARIGREEGLQFVYAGNLPGEMGNLENTYCPTCKTLLVERTGFRVHRVTLRNGCCPSCSSRIPGVWS